MRIRAAVSLPAAALMILLACLSAGAGDLRGSGFGREIVIQSQTRGAELSHHTAPAGLEFLTLGLFVLPLSEPIAGLDMTGTSRIEDADGFAYAPENIPPDAGAGFGGPQDFPAGTGTFGQLVFLVPAGAAGLTFIHDTGAGEIRVPLDAAAPATPGPATGGLLAGPQTRGGFEVAVEALTETAGAVTLSVVVTNRSDTDLRGRIADFLMLVEDHRFGYPVATADGEGFAEEAVLPIGQPMDGTVRFDVPAGAGSLDLIVFTGEGTIDLPATPARQQANFPVLAGPVTSSALAATLRSFAERQDLAASEAGDRIFVADLDLALTDPTEMTSADFPIEFLTLIDAAGTRYPATLPEGLRHPLGRVPIWVGQPLGGEVAFEVPAGFVPEGATIEVNGTDPLIQLPVTGAAAGAAESAPNGGAPGAEAGPAPQPGAAAPDVNPPSREPEPTGVSLVLLPAAPQTRQPIVLDYAGMPGGAGDWIALAARGAADDTYLQQFATGGADSGRITFDGRPAGDYEIRAYFNWPDGGYRVEARLPFTIAHPATDAALALGRQDIRAGQPITAVWAGLPGNDGDWIALASADMPDTSNGIAWAGTNGRVAGRKVFAGQPAGRYELRAYFAGDDSVQVRVPFDIAPASTGEELVASPEPDNPAVAGLTDVAQRTLGALAQVGGGSEAAVDGDAVNYDDRRGYADLLTDRPNRFWLAQPYPVETVRFLLWDGDQRTYRYRLLGSPDGVTWDTLIDHTADGVSGGWQQFDAADTEYLAFALTDVGTDAGDGVAPIVEFAAYSRVAPPAPPALDLPDGNADPPAWQDQVLAAPLNVALPGLGASPSADQWAAALIDGDEGELSFAASAIGRPIQVDFDRPYSIARLHLAFSANIETCHYRVEGSADGQAWRLLTERSFAGPSQADEIPLADLPVLKSVRITATGVTGADSLQLRELAAFTGGPEPFTGLAEPLAGANETGQGNLALALYGGRVEGVTSEADLAHDRLHLTDGVLAGGWQAGDAGLPQAVTLSFADRRPALVGALDLYAGGDGSPPRLVEISAASADPGGGWQRLGRYLLQDIPAQRITVTPFLARALRVTVLETYRTSPASIGELAVREAARPGYASLLPYRRVDFEGGIDLANVALGGHIERAAPADPDPDYGPSLLIDGFALGHGYWAPSDDFSVPELVFSFAGGQSARIGGVALSPNGGSSSFTGRGRWASVFEVWTSQESPTAGFHRVGRYRLDQADRTEVFAFAPVQARFVRIILLDTNGALGAVLGEVEVLEASVPGYRSILADRPPNLLDYRFGGNVAVPAGDRRTDLIDSTSATPGWSAQGSVFPVAVTFGFWHSQPRRFDAIGFNPRTDADRATWARSIKVLASDNPVRDFTEIGTFVIAPEDRLQYFAFPPLTRRYVQIRILANNGSDQGVSLGDVFVREAPLPGELSALARPVDAPPEEAWEPAGPPAEASATDLVEIEPNDRPGEANALPLGRPLAARIDPSSDVDWFAVDTGAAGADALSLAVQQIPTLHVGIDLADAAGRPVATEPLFDRGTDRAETSWQVPPGRYLVRVARPANSIVFIVDRSGSVSDVRNSIAAVAAQFARQVRPGEAISFATIDGQTLSDFSSDPAVLLRAALATAEGEGGSGIYQAILDARDRLAGRTGAKAIVLVTDGEDSGPGELLDTLWALLPAGGVRVYTVGYGTKVSEPLDGLLGSTGGDMLRNFSRATGGRFYYAPSGEALAALYPQIAADLRGDSAYRLTATAPAGTGTLRVVETGEPIVGVSAPSEVELILDASGSMRAKVSGNQTRMDVARAVLHDVVDHLPDGTMVGLRVYGHRLPSEPKPASCRDTELVVPFGGLDRDRLNAAIDAVRPRGQTPIGLSLAALPQDFDGVPGGKVVIVVTDGIETCDPSPGDTHFPPAVVASLIAGGISLKVNVVGFEIGDSQTRAFLADIAAAGNGEYFDAGGAEQLTAALAEAVRAGFTVTDASGRIVASGKVGDPPLDLPEGTWHVTLATDPSRDLGDVPITANALTELRITKEGDHFAVAVAAGATH